MVDRIGHYRIVSELGRGGMGVVYKAHEESLNRFVALKVLGEHLTEDPAHVERFLREAQSAARLNHPNIVQIYTVSEDAGKHYFAMEFVSGQSLQQILRSKGTLDSIQAARVAIQTASGLGAAHDQGIIHRDIKPANLMIDERGLVKIADFGLALMGGAVSRLTATGMFMGTPGYLSPEQCLDQDIDYRTDIYSLGVTIFEALSGKAPFTGDSPLALLRQIIDVEPPDLGELNPDVEPELRDLVARMMAKDRDQRISSCTELAAGLEAFLQSKGASGTLVERLAAFTSAAVPPPPPTEPFDLDTEPTMAVSGESPDPGAPRETRPAVEPQAPRVESAPLPAPPSNRGRNLAIAAAIVVLLGFGAVVVGGIVAWKTGLFDFASRTATDGPRQAVAAAKTPGETVQHEPDQEATESLDAETAVTGAETGGTEAAQPDASRREPSEPTPADVVSEPRPTPISEQQAAAAAPPVRHPQPKNGVRQPRHDPPPTVAPLPEGTVVIAVGEQLLAGEAESYIEAAFARAGIPLVDEATVPGLSALIGSGEMPRPGEVHAMLKPYVRHLVMVRIEYLGERPLTYMGQRDVAFQARVSMVPIDVQNGGALAQPSRFRVEYTHLSATRVVEKEFRQPTYRLIQAIDRQ